ncbi:MAG TPA: InlB B-repeat-containing protein [Bacillota bacterium]|nr:InlB B-repeat-containing protein [Bacillota bacterium]
MKNLRKSMVGLICLVLVSALIVGCGGGKKKDNTDPTPKPPSGESKIVLELNVGQDLAALQGLSLPSEYKGFTFGKDIAFESNTKSYEGETYTGRIKLGGSDRQNRSITFSAKAGDVLKVLAMSSSSTGTGRILMVAPVSGDGVELGEVPTSNLNAFTYNIPADGEYMIYSSKDGINIYYISLTGIRTDTPATKYKLTIKTEGNGSVEPTAGTHEYDAGTTVTLTATAAEGFKFTGWSGDLTGSENPATITMNGNKTVTAVFEKETPGTPENPDNPTPVQKYTLTVQSSEGGTVELNPAGGTYDAGTTVTLTAKPNTGYKFSKWEGAASGTSDTVTVTMDGDKTVKAIFEKEVVTYKLTVNVTGQGSVTVNPDNETRTYESGSKVTVTATPAAGYKFSKWEGAASGSSATVVITMDKNKTVTAVFVEDVPVGKVELPFTEDFDSATSSTFFTTSYKTLPGDSTTPLYSRTGGAINVVDGQLQLVGGRFTIGDNGTGNTTSTTIPKGVFDLSKAYKIKVKIVAVSGSGKFMIYVDNNTSSGTNSIHGNNSVLKSFDGTTLTVGEVLEVPGSVGTESSFIQIRAESTLTVTIDDLVIEYQ